MQLWVDFLANFVCFPINRSSPILRVASAITTKRNDSAGCKRSVRQTQAGWIEIDTSI